MDRKRTGNKAKTCYFLCEGMDLQGEGQGWIKCFQTHYADAHNGDEVLVMEFGDDKKRHLGFLRSKIRDGG